MNRAKDQGKRSLKDWYQHGNSAKWITKKSEREIEERLDYVCFNLMLLGPLWFEELEKQMWSSAA